MNGPPTIFLSAGEASGDHYGGQLITALRQLWPSAHFSGLGGLAMQQAGQQRIVRAEDVAVMGITEVLWHIPTILGSYVRLVRSIRRNRPDVAVLIDFPDVNFRLARHLRRMHVPVIWFVSPQLWAWKRRRLRWVQQRVSKMLTIFPFEQQFYRNRGVEAEFVGHPLAEQPLPHITRAEYAEAARDLAQTQWSTSGADQEDHVRPGQHEPIRYSLDPGKQWIALLPGSRSGEIFAHLPVLVAAAAELDCEQRYEFVIPIASSAEKHLAAMQRDTARVCLSHRPNPPRITFVRDARAALLHSRAAVVTSGTATVQAAVLGTPFVAVYKVSRTTFQLAKRLVRYPAEIAAEQDRYGNLPVAMVNLVAGRRVVPELLQDQFTAVGVVAALRPLLTESPERTAQLQGLAEVRDRLLPNDGTTSMQRLRDAVRDVLEASRTPLAAESP